MTTAGGTRDVQQIVPCLWFKGDAEEAMALYTSLFPGSRVGDAMRGPDGALISGTYELRGQRFMVLNGRGDFSFNEAVSLFVDCEDQDEVDRLWDALTSGGGEESQCGWLKDRFGVSWQIIPRALMEVLGDPDPARAQRGMEAMLAMRKIDIAALRAAQAGE
jgi:predicted 3-demethylubiquinone-9 3-methyltransferase (glyoxalase superfamily)